MHGARIKKKAMYFSVQHSGIALSNGNAPCSYVIYELNLYICCISFTAFRWL